MMLLANQTPPPGVYADDCSYKVSLPLRSVSVSILTIGRRSFNVEHSIRLAREKGVHTREAVCRSSHEEEEEEGKGNSIEYIKQSTTVKRCRW